MDEPDLFTVFVRPLHSAGVRYMITGSVASMYYGEPRFTLDVDLLVHVEKSEIERISAAYPEENYYLPPPEVIAEEIARSQGGHFNVVHHESGLKADFYPSRQHPYWSWAWERRREATVESHPAFFAPPEYVIISKLEFYREGGSDKHLRDIHSMLMVSGDKIERGLLEKAVHELGLSDAWRKATRT